MPWNHAKINGHRTDDWYRAKLRDKSTHTERGCWEWQGFRQPVTGYGEISYHGKQTRVHRLAYRLSFGPIPPGGNVLHSCDVRHCCNPDHLRLGTISDNKQDELARGRNYEANRAQCTRGHAYAEHGVRVGKNQWRQCRICARGRQRVKAGWPEDLAYSLGPMPLGHRPFGPSRKRAGMRR